MNYKLVISRAEIDCSFTYRVVLWYVNDDDKEKIAESFFDTIRGSKRWAKRMAKAHKARQGREPFRLVWEFEV